MINRKEIKENAKHVLKGHYVIMVVACLVAAVIGTSFTGTLSFLDANSYNYALIDLTDEDTEASSSTISGFGLSSIYNAVLSDTVDNLEKAAEEKEKEAIETPETKIGGVSIGRTKGVLASIANKVNSGSLLVSIYAGVRSMFNSATLANVLFIIVSILIYAGFWVFVTNVYNVIYYRIFLEARTYKTVPKARFLFLVKNRCWLKATWAMLLAAIYEILWNFTIVGGIIKHFSYMLVPCIVAENPDISAREAITLSRKMMKGHKWEACVMLLSFLGWEILSVITMGILGLFFLNPYKTATIAEYYAAIRKSYIENNGENCQLLNDRYLYEQADDALIRDTYGDLIEAAAHPVEEAGFSKPYKKFLAYFFGIVLTYDQEEKVYRDKMTKKSAIESCRSILDKEVYPTRLSPNPINQKVENYDLIGYRRCYSIASVIALFFTMSIVGWLWEVSLHFISDGEFVNRGVNHGPWLPIYGTGCVLILLVLNRFRGKTWLEFLSAVVLCGAVEYSTAYFLEMTHNGQKWWDYTGYFLNIHGRVCAEGLLIFGIGGCAFVYFLAPLIDNRIRKMNPKVLLPILGVLLVTYGVDSAYSKVHPNQGKGITDTGSSAVVEVVSAESSSPEITAESPTEN